jgi:hypothetical protein
MSRAALYDSCQPIKTAEFPASRPHIGVSAHGPYHHAGFNAQAADVSYDRVSLGAATFGNSVRLEEMPEKIIELTVRVIADLDDKIQELQQHRDRLAAELENLRKVNSTRKD